ncbi:MAG: hybrid sensor histidine kinase/response regulator [Burkholderiaceae bacterium]
MQPAAPLDLLIQLSAAGQRADTCERLARKMGVDAIYLLVNDPVLGNPIPAVGMAQTVRGGREWRRFIQRCGRDGEFRGTVDVPTSEVRQATAVAVGGAAFVMVGGEPSAAAVQSLHAVMPLLAALLGAEMRKALADSEVELAKEAAAHSNAISLALESARSEAARLNARLAEEHTRKDEFLAMLAHELRNPLAGVLAAAQVLRLKGHEGPTGARAVAVIERQSHQLSRLVNDLTDVARVSRGRIELKTESIDLKQALANAVEANCHSLEANRHVLRVREASTPLWVCGDPARLTQVFSNLLHNAAKYTDPGGRIMVEQDVEGDMAVIRITDNGIGISADMLPLVFELFTQAPVAIARSQGGLGLGLTLVRKLVALHGGSIEAYSEGKGKGSAFTVRLPLHPHAGTTDAGACQAPRPAQLMLRVLVVDDNVDAAESLGALLGASGHHVSVVHSGADALAQIDAHPWDLLVFDLGLPDIDGYALAREVRRRHGPAVRMVALTGYDGSEVREATAQAGFDVHLVKPFSDRSLDVMVGTAVQP